MSSEQRFPRSFTLGAWSIAGLLAVIALLLAFPRNTPWLAQASAQQPPLLGARGVYAFPIQLTAKTYGICMLDVDAGTLWIYEYTSRNRLRLACARSWEFDRYLGEYNVEGLVPGEVGDLVSKQRSRRQAASDGSGLPAAADAPAQVPPDEPDSSGDHKE